MFVSGRHQSTFPANVDLEFGIKKDRGVKAPLPEIKKWLSSSESQNKKAIDGARTRGLDLGKVARYQLRHYRLRSFEQNIYYYTFSYMSIEIF